LPCGCVPAGFFARYPRHRGLHSFPTRRSSDLDTGLWNESQTSAWTRINRFIAEQGAVPAVQLAHAGRKASTDAPWRGGGMVGPRSEEHTSELQSREKLVCRLLRENKKKNEPVT